MTLWRFLLCYWFLIGCEGGISARQRDNTRSLQVNSLGVGVGGFGLQTR